MSRFRRVVRDRFGSGSPASTGSLTDIHEIRFLRLDSLEPLPVLRLTKTNDSPFTSGRTGRFTLTASVHGEAGAKLRQPVTVVDQIPFGHVDGPATGRNWSCADKDQGSGSELTCRHATSSPIPAGESLPPITVPFRFAADRSCAYEESSATNRYEVRPVGVPDTTHYSVGEPVEIPSLDHDHGAVLPDSVKITVAHHGTAAWEPSATGGVLVYVPDPGSTATEHLTYTADDACGQTTNPTEVTIEPTQPITPTERAADLQVNKVADASEAPVGGRLAYTVTVHNAGTSPASDVHYADVPQEHARLIAVRTDTGQCGATFPIMCKLGILGSGATATIHVELEPLQPGPLVNVGAASAPATDPSPSKAHDTARATVTPPQPQITLLKLRSRRFLHGGDTVRFVLIAGVRTLTTAQHVRVCDHLPAGVTLVSAPGSDHEGRLICWSIPHLAKARRRHLQPPLVLARPPTRCWRAIVHPDAQPRSEPGDRGRTLPKTATRGTRWLLVLATHRASRDTCWIAVRLPERPNSGAVWLNIRSATVSEDPWRIEVWRRSRRIALLRSGRIVQSARVVIGRPSLPTPVGLFAVINVVP